MVQPIQPPHVWLYRKAVKILTLLQWLCLLLRRKFEHLQRAWRLSELSLRLYAVVSSWISSKILNRINQLFLKQEKQKILALVSKTYFVSKRLVELVRQQQQRPHPSFDEHSIELLYFGRRPALVVSFNK